MTTKFSPNYSKNRQWADSATHEIKRIIGEFLIQEADENEDMHHNTDLVMHEHKFAIRIRDNKYLEKYGHQITLRGQLESGNDTELYKITVGEGDLLFYGFYDKKKIYIEQWIIADIKVLRAHILEKMWKSRKPFEEVINDDGTKGVAINIDDVKGKFVLYKSQAVKQLISRKSK